MLMPSVLTMTAASCVFVCLDTPEMDSPVQVSHLALTFIHINYHVINTNMTVYCNSTLADHNHSLTAHVCKRSRIYLLFKN